MPAAVAHHRPCAVLVVDVDIHFRLHHVADAVGLDKITRHLGLRALREQLRVTRPGGVVLAMGSQQPKPPVVRFFANIFNRFPTEQQYVRWFEEAGFSGVTHKYISNPWNSQQYALAICGTKADGTPQPTRAREARRCSEPCSAAYPISSSSRC